MNVQSFDTLFWIKVLGAGLAVLPFVFAWPGFLAPRGTPWWRYFLNVLVIFLGIVVPLVWFGLSSMLTPDSKSACELGWLHCFVTGKLALVPLVFWACASFYALEVMRLERFGSWLPLGLGSGVVVSAVCLLQGLACLKDTLDAVWAWIVPVYTPLWYGWAFRRSWRIQKPSSSGLKWTVLGSLPAWGVSVWFSHRIYRGLPEMRSGCYVVTAASKGHRLVVGARRPVSRHGEPVGATEQLLIFWQFEDLWRLGSPATHAIFRALYNRIGPIAASLIRDAWLADCAYLSLKPAEWIARSILRLAKSR